MSTPVGRNTRIEIAKTFGAAINVTGITAAAVPEVTIATLPLVNTFGYFDQVGGMAQLEGQPARVFAPATGKFTIQGLTTESYTPFSGTAQWNPVTAWALLSKQTSYEIPNAESAKLDYTGFEDIVAQEEAGLLAAQSVSLSGFSMATSEGIQLINAAAINGVPILVRMTLSNGEQRLFRGTPSLPGESGSVGALATSSLSFASKGRVLFLPKVV